MFLQGLNPISPAGNHEERFAGKARHFHSNVWQLISVLFKVQCDSKPICAARAKSRSPGACPWKSCHTSCTIGYCRVQRMHNLQGSTALYRTTCKSKAACESGARTEGSARGSRVEEGGRRRCQIIPLLSCLFPMVTVAGPRGLTLNVKHAGALTSLHWHL